MIDIMTTYVKICIVFMKCVMLTFLASYSQNVPILIKTDDALSNKNTSIYDSCFHKIVTIYNKHNYISLNIPLFILQQSDSVIIVIQNNSSSHDSIKASIYDVLPTITTDTYIPPQRILRDIICEEKKFINVTIWRSMKKNDEWLANKNNILKKLERHINNNNM